MSSSGIIDLPCPILRASCFSSFIALGFRNSSQIAHSKVVDVVSMPAPSMS
ncbi:hypothetical protein Hanom_Chr05g00460511 [Helianthus anomalus]